MAARRPRHRATWVCAAALALVAAGLTGPASAATSPSEPPSSAPAVAAPSPRAIAEAGLLAPGDVPTTWTASKIAAGGGEFGPDDVAACRRVTRTIDRARDAFKVSDRFTRDTVSASSSVSVYASTRKAQTALRAIGGRDAGRCLASVLRGQLRDAGAKGKPSPISVSVVKAPAPSVGDSSIAFLVDAHGSAPTGDVGVAAMLVAIRVGKATLAVTLGGGTDAPSVDTVTHLVDQPVARLTQVQAS